MHEMPFILPKSNKIELNKKRNRISSQISRDNKKLQLINMQQYVSNIREENSFLKYQVDLNFRCSNCGFFNKSESFQNFEIKHE